MSAKYKCLVNHDGNDTKSYTVIIRCSKAKSVTDNYVNSHKDSVEFNSFEDVISYYKSNPYYPYLRHLINEEKSIIREIYNMYKDLL